MHAPYVIVCLACKLVCMHHMCLHAWAHISAKFGRIRKMKVSIESGKHNRPIWFNDTTQASKRACIHAMCLPAWAHISAILGQIREIKVYVESGKHAGLLWAHNLTGPRKLACMHPMCLHAQAHISAKVGRIREIKVSMESGEHARGCKIQPGHTSLHACMLFACMIWPISQPNWVGAERWRYLWNQENIPDLSEYIMWPKHTS